MKKIHAIVLAVFIVSICIIGCGKEETPNQAKSEEKTETFSMENLTKRLEEAVLEGDSQIVCSYQGKAEQLNDQVNQELEDSLSENYICKNLIDTVDVQWNQKGKNAEASIKMTFQDGVELPVVTAKNEDEVVKGLIEGWESGKEKVTVVLQGCSYQEDEIFSMLDGAEINSATLPCEADSVYYQAYDPEGDQQILKMWLDFGTDADSLKEKQDELTAKIQSCGEEIKAQGLTDDAEMYRAIYQKVLELAQYDDSIAVVTDLERLGTQTRIQRSAYGALVDGNTVCTGYARGYKALCDYLGLPCQVVVGEHKGVNHSWNRVKVGDEMLYVDCTTGDTGYTEEQSCLFTKEQMDADEYIMDEQYVIPEI